MHESCVVAWRALAGNSTAAAAAWKGGAQMSSLAGRTVQLTVSVGAGCKLYSLRGDFAWKPE